MKKSYICPHFGWPLLMVRIWNMCPYACVFHSAQCRFYKMEKTKEKQLARARECRDRFAVDCRIRARLFMVIEKMTETGGKMENG